jgi:hypothetical protein
MADVVDYVILERCYLVLFHGSKLIMFTKANVVKIEQNTFLTFFSSLQAQN